MCKSFRSATTFAHRSADYIRSCVKAFSLPQKPSTHLRISEIPSGKQAFRGNFANPRSVICNIYRLLSTKMNSQNQILKESEFSKIFSQKLVQKVENLKILSIEKLYIKTKYNEEENQHFLENAYSEYKNEPTELDEIIQKYLNITDSLYSPETELKIENILPVIKDYRYLDEVNQLRADSETQQLYEKYNDNLYIFYVEDTETCINYLNEDDLKFLNITFSELREIAIQNLKNFEIEK